jgi:mono/diheme cytochrome c family protein
MARFGAPTLAWETRQDYPHLWGTRRIGPDLSRASGTRPADWQFAHLYSPRSIVPGSVMPAYPGLFDGAPDRPRQDARDLLAYLESLGRARALAGPEGEARARQACDCADDEMRQMAFEAGLDVHPGKARSGDDVPALPAARNDTRGRVLYARHCATCHGPAGEGDVGGGMGLLPRPVSLADHAYTTERIAEALWNGVAGTAMPAWRDHPLEDLAAIAHVVRGMTAARPEPTLPADLIEAGPRVYADHCVQCHGERGAGDGTAAKELPIAPTNFQRQRPSLDYALRALREGIAGTPMAPWPSRLSEGEMLAVANYVRSFSAGTLRTTGGSSR